MTNTTRRIGHDMDDDGCCTYCGMDLVEPYHLRQSLPPHAREPMPEWERYCLRKEEDVRRGKVQP